MKRSRFSEEQIIGILGEGGDWHFERGTLETGDIALGGTARRSGCRAQDAERHGELHWRRGASGLSAN